MGEWGDVKFLPVDAVGQPRPTFAAEPAPHQMAGPGMMHSIPPWRLLSWRSLINPSPRVESWQ